jgi:hypothetical protein
MKRLIAAFLCCLLTVPVGAQAPSSARPVRIRITGPATYEVPGVWRFDGDRVIVVGKAITGDSRFVQFTREEDGQVLTILRPGRRLTGTARGMAGDVLEFVPEGNTEHIHIPLDALTKIEVSRERRPLERSLEAGLFTGLGIFLAAWRWMANSCDEGSCGSISALFGLVGGVAIASGAVVARKMRGQRWEAVSIDILLPLLDPPQHPGTAPAAPRSLPAGPSH